MPNQLALDMQHAYVLLSVCVRPCFSADNDHVGISGYLHSDEKRHPIMQHGSVNCWHAAACRNFIMESFDEMLEDRYATKHSHPSL